MWNASRLPEDWTLEKLIGNHTSQPYNPDIASAFFRTGRTESWGRGIENIFHTCREAGLPEPVYDLEINGLLMTFPFSYEYLRVATESGVSYGITPKTKDNIGTISERIRNDFGKDVANTFVLVRDHPDLTAEQISKQIGKSTRSIENYIKKLKDAGIIKRRGARLGGYWEIVDDE